MITDRPMVLDMAQDSPVPARARSPILRLALISLASVLIYGYHLGVDDAAIYVPAIKKAADPALYWFGSEFFMSHAHLSLFPDLVGGLARLTRLPVDSVIFLFQVAGVFLLLYACWRLACACFQHQYARWAGVALVAGVLSVPVAGTALVIMDPYVTARTLSTPATVLAIACYASNQTRRALVWLLVATLIHPQMSIYAAALLACLAWTGRVRPAAGPARFGMLGLAPLLSEFEPARGAAREALLSRTFLFVSNWAWYEWIGVFAPLGLLWWMSAARPSGTTPMFRRLARTLVLFGLLATAAGLLLVSSIRFESLNRLQPMRSFHLLYIIFFALLGGLIGEYALRTSAWRWLCLFLPLAAAMSLLELNHFPSSPHLEWPGYRGHNAWLSAFYWIREHTPKDAVFALDPRYMLVPGEDLHGFRAVADRSVLADEVKDSGAVSMFPQLAGDWKAQVRSQTGWAHFQLNDFQRLAQDYPVTWILTQRSRTGGLVCPFADDQLSVCRLAAAGAPEGVGP